MKDGRFEIGDKVVANSRADKRYSITKNGWTGVVADIKENYDLDTDYTDDIFVKNRSHEFWVNHKYFDLVGTETSQKSVIIQNVSMPDCCGECLAFGTTGCIFVNVDTDTTDIWKERASNCPMRPYK